MITKNKSTKIPISRQREKERKRKRKDKIRERKKERGEKREKTFMTCDLISVMLFDISNVTNARSLRFTATFSVNVCTKNSIVCKTIEINSVKEIHIKVSFGYL